MPTQWTSKELRDFESEIANLFNEGKIKAPVHLSSGNEDALINIFKDISRSDWVLGSWRSHYHCLLKGVSSQQITNEILAGRSISLNFPEHKIFTSAIVAGQVPIAIGIALAQKISNSGDHVWCFIGDMTSETGIVQTSIRYAEKHDLPITFIVEDNQLSVLTNTRKVWATNTLRYQEIKSTKVISYQYKNIYPHAGAGKRIQF
jgi:pyruvate dehydrogenase E1 component alpha subunit